MKNKGKLNPELITFDDKKQKLFGIRIKNIDNDCYVFVDFYQKVKKNEILNKLKELKTELRQILHVSVYFIDSDDMTSQIRIEEIRKGISHIVEVKDLYSGDFVPLTMTLHEEKK